MKPLEKEKFVRKRLEEMLGVPLPKRKLIVGYLKNFPKIHEFDLVSDDVQIVGEVTSSKGDYRGALTNCVFLSKVKAKKKILAFTNANFYVSFKSRYEGILPNDIEMMLIRLDFPEIRV